MGNTEGSPKIGRRLVKSRKPSQQSLSGSLKGSPPSTRSQPVVLPPLPKAVEVIDDSGYEALSERDVAFLCSQTSKRRRRCSEDGFFICRFYIG